MILQRAAPASSNPRSPRAIWRGRATCPASRATAFARIARAVEVSLFGGQPVDAGVWDECRAAYAELTVPKAWATA